MENSPSSRSSDDGYPPNEKAQRKPEVSLFENRESQVSFSQTEKHFTEQTISIKKEKTARPVEGSEEKGESELRHVDYGNCVTVYFHAVLSEHFKPDPKTHRVFVRAGGISGFKDWEDNVCELIFSKHVDKHSYLIEGKAFISKDNMDKPIPYKYFVKSGDTEEYEYIYKLSPEGVHVNRCLFIKSDDLCGTDWHQYDDQIYASPSKDTRKKSNKYLSNSDVSKGKQRAGKIMLESLFSVLETWTFQNIKSFFQQLQQFYFVNKEPKVYMGGPQKWSEIQFGEKEVQKLIKVHLTNVVYPRLNWSSAADPSRNLPPKKKLELSLILLHLYGDYEIFSKKREKRIRLCNLLCLEMPEADSIVKDFKTEFSEVPHMCFVRHLKSFCNICMGAQVHEWLWIIPVLHIFSDFECFQDNSQLEFEEKWAGLEGLEFLKYRNQMERNNPKKGLLSLMKEKKHLVEKNGKLFRSWFSLLPLGDLEEFISIFPSDPLDCLAGTFHRLKSEKVTCFNSEKVERLLKKVLSLHLDQKGQLQVDTWNLYATVCTKLHKMCCKIENIKDYEVPALSAKIVSRIIELAPLKVSEEKNMQNTPTKLFQSLCADTSEFFRRITPSELLKPCSGPDVEFTFLLEPKAWDEFLKISFPTANFTEEWTKTLTKDVQSRMKKENPDKQIKAYCNNCLQLESSDSPVGKVFESCAIEAVNLVNQGNLIGLISSYQDLKRPGKLLSAVIRKSWPSDKAGKPLEDLRYVLLYLFSSQEIRDLFTLNDERRGILDQLTDEAKGLMKTLNSAYMKVSDELITGDILIQHLDLINNHKIEFLDIWELMNLPKVNQKEKMKLEKALTMREEEIKFLREEQKQLGSLLEMCRKVQDIIKVDITEIEEKRSQSLAAKTLNEVVKVRDPNSHGDECIETCCYLNPSLKKISETVNCFKDSHIFQHSWKWAARQLVNNGEENNDVLSPDCLFDPCCKEFIRLCSDLQSEELMFSEVDTLFKDFTDHYDELKNELQILCKFQPQNGQKWIDERFQQIKQYHELHLAVGSVKVIDKIREGLHLSGNFKDLILLLNFVDEFQLFQERKLSSMTSALIRAMKILQGITEPRRRCLEELALRMNFVSWVKESLKDINELKVFVDLASISAGENDMDVDRVACFHDAVLGYSSLLYELKQESGFEELLMCLEKLWKALESDHHLPTKLCDSARHLEWLKDIRESHGSVELTAISLAAAINKKGNYIIRAPAEAQKVSLDTILRLTISEGHDEQEEVRKYSLGELRELMNKLMLMSGKAEQSAEVDNFSEVFSSVQRLALSFIDLYSSGNLLFRSWNADIYCSPHNECYVSMNFSANADENLLENGEVTEILPAICRQMESFLERWNRFMSEKRSQYFYLNYYTAEQVVYLCRELGSAHPSEAALMMLSLIKHNCSKQEVQEISRLLKSEKPKRNFTDLCGLMARERELTAQLEHIWDSYMEGMGSFFPDCLDIETLGAYLDKLARLEKRNVVRILPQGLHAGRPNLILCPRSEVLASALAIYMNSPEEMPPSYDEVLLCTAQTSYEEVALFLRRCLTPGCKERKIYTLLFADELSYDVGYRSEELFRSLHLKHQDDYRLVILCNCEREHCYVPSVFSQYQVHMIPHQPLKDIQSYLENHFKATQPVNSLVTFFKDKLCVGIVSSKRAGLGKSLYVKRLHKKMEAELQGEIPLKTIRVVDSHVDESKVLKFLHRFLDQKYQDQPVIFHFDITSSMQTGILEFLFKLLVLQYLSDTNGKLWVRKQCHLYIVEILEASPSEKQVRSTFPGLKNNFLDVFPKIICKSPKEVLEMATQKEPSLDFFVRRIDQEVFCSEAFQRPFQYVRRVNKGDNLDRFQYKEGSIEGTPLEYLQLFLIHCGVKDPSWSELRNFAWFLNLQLRNCETSVFCNADFVQDTLQGFKNFVVNFMILMAKDFATPSLSISDESPGKQFFDMEGVTEEDLAPFRIRKKWESEPHPYIFFNEDCISMTFIGFHLQPNPNGGIDAINPLNGNVIKRNVMTTQLYKGLVLQKVPFNIDFDALPRHEKIETLCMVLGLQRQIDPDETYELTTDNILKILAIEMRFRCGIPVVLMGETGCGKTRLVKFLCELHKSGAAADNMKLVKVHGGTTAEAIYAKVREAEALAIDNKQQYQFDTILFFDEANTTEAVSSIKEVLCDHTVQGEPLLHSSGLQVIAACNPYRKHTDKMIQRLESAGLGYRVKAEETKEKLGSIPLRQLVYRVHALPPSMMPLVWDFGQLNNFTEKLYIQQIVQRLTRSIRMSEIEIQIITDVLFESQTYMRRRTDECSFISLRDVERCVAVFKWFHGHSELLMWHLEKHLAEKKTAKGFVPRDKVIWSLVLSIGVCYHASLEKKENYRKVISKILPEPYDHEKGILEEISLVQDLFLSGAPLRDTIARNQALKENVFMMVICIELKIPLFLIGKPGSSKSLAKAIVADAMQGQAAYSELYKELKQIHLVSFQCSPHSTPEGIINTFKHCARFQEGKNLKEYVSVVVLDEIGLAEDSPKMPLKTLHPLLEDGCVDDEPLPHKKVGFIGISNWALDPAKMNRGIFVSRGNPDGKELTESAKGICSSERIIMEKIEHFFPIFADAYEEICKVQTKEFFGLRDFYSLIKMIFALAKKSKKSPAPRDIAEVVLRNFSGKEDVEALNIFMSKIPEKGDIISEDLRIIDLVKQNIYNDYQDGECRYLLVLTKNYAALQILQHTLFKDTQQPEIIFGSSFPKDQEYTQICRNINRVKICMETGQMVILLNLQNLYESLYDALNQYYVQLAGQKYVDLGLGTHRVKCRVHPKFRLIVIEEKEVVYKHFPIPLINRLEKHYLDINTILDKWQRDIVEELKKWVNGFTTVDTQKYFMDQQKYTPSDVFVGYHSDTCASVVLQVTEKLKADFSPQELIQKVQEQAKLVLLNCATPDSMVRLGHSRLGSFLADELASVYFQQQQHNSLPDFLSACLGAESRSHTVFTEITTFSRLLTATDTETLKAEVQGNINNLKVVFLQQFDTEYSFLKEIRNFLDATHGRKILIIQTDFENGSLSSQLIASAKYSTVNEINKMDVSEASVFVFFITKLSRIEGGSSYVGFHGGLWQSVHIDDLRRSHGIVTDVTALRNISISQLFSGDVGETTESHEFVMAEKVKETEEEMDVEIPAEPRLETLATEILDTTVLLRSCVQSAVGMLRDQNEGASRSTKRIEILLGLLSKDDDLKASFLRITKCHLLSLLKKQEENSYTMKEWVLREASNIHALQEAGTFRRTLWKRVQNVVTPFLACILSVIDRDCNLDLLVRPTTESCVKALWMFIYSDVKLLTIPYVMDQSSSQTKTLLVENGFTMSVHAGSTMPFSWRIKDYLEDLWIQAQYITGSDGHEEKFVDIFQQTPLGKYIASLSKREKDKLFHCYLRDFLLLAMGVSSHSVLTLLEMALLSCIEEMKAASSSTEEKVLPLPWIHLGYHQFGSRLQNFSRILAVNPAVFDALNQKGNIPHDGMVLDVLAAVACTEMLEKKMLKWPLETWLQQVKNLQTPIELVCSAKYLRNSRSQYNPLLQKIRNHWNQIFSMSLFVEHVLLGTEKQIPEVKDLVKRYTLQLRNCFQNDSDIKAYSTFTAVLKTLCQCKEEISSSFCRYGLKPCPICWGDPRDPVSLPCEHVYCHSCIKKWLMPGRMFCAVCRVDLPNDYTLTESEELSIAIKKNAQFRKFCNSFFVDLISMMCFKDNEPPEEAVIKELLELLFAHKELLQGSGNSVHTKCLSPFDDVVDKTPVIRSVVLKLLLKYSFNHVKNHLQKYLSDVEESGILDKEDKMELYMLFVSCFEDSVCEKSGAFSEEIKINHLKRDGDFLENYLRWSKSSQHDSEESSIEDLQGVAHLRLCMDRAAELLFEPHGTSVGSEESEKQIYLQRVKEFFCQAQNDWHRVYLVRKLINQYGLEFMHKRSTEHEYQWIFPSGIIQLQQAAQIDRFLVYGRNYRVVRDALGKAMTKCQTDGIATALKACNESKSGKPLHFLLAIFRELTSLYGCGKEQCDVLKEFIRTSRVLPSPQLEAFADSLLANSLPSLRLSPQDPSQKTVVVEMAVHAAAVLLSSQNPILEPLRNLAFSPNTMRNAFLPTMPEDLLAQAVKWQATAGLRWYTCPNGHPCTVGECGMPMQLGSCIDCGAKIGGEHHKPVSGFHEKRDRVDRTQTGHVLGDPRKREAVITSEREMRPVVLILIRLLTHLAMLVGATKDPQSLLQIIKPKVQDPVGFLQQHIHEDLEQLKKTLGRSADESINCVHLILYNLLKEHSGQGQIDGQLSTKEQRNNWERVVAHAIILPEPQLLDKRLLELNRQISEDKRVASNLLVKIAYEDPTTLLSSLPKNSILHCSRMWSCRKKISVEYLGHVVQQKDGKETVPILWKFLQKEAELRLVKFLPEILTLQKDLVKRFQNMSEIEHKRIGDFLHSLPSGGMKRIMISRVKTFLDVWNKLRSSLETNSEIRLPRGYCDADLTLESEFEILLPRRRGLGLCSTALASYLIALHNDFVYAVEKYTTDANRYSVNPAEVADLHVITYEIERDLIPLILSNCQYSMEKGGEAVQEFDLEKIQQQVISRFLQGKPLITPTGIPTLVYRHDRNYEHLFKDIKSKLTQSCLPNSTISMLSGELKSYSDICEALFVTEITLGFLAMAGGDPEMILTEYVENTLQMGSQTSAHVLQALSRCHLKHTISLWQLLCSHKSEQLLYLKRDPFAEISTPYKDELTKEHAKLLNAFLTQAGLECFLQELHEMIVLKLKHTQAGEEFNPKWRLKDTLIPYLERKESNTLLEELQMFPKEIQLSQCVAVWKVAATLKQDRRLD